MRVGIEVPLEGNCPTSQSSWLVANDAVECVRYLRTAEWDSSTLSQDWETMSRSQLCHQPAVILTWMHLQGEEPCPSCSENSQIGVGLENYIGGYVLWLWWQWGAVLWCWFLGNCGKVTGGRTVGSCGFLQVCGGQVAAWMGLDAQRCVTIPAWLQGDLSFLLKPKITGLSGPTTTLLHPVRAQWVHSAACE